MAPTIGLNLRVTGYCSQGGRKYMEDVFSVAYQQTEDEKDLEYAFFGIFDGHGGREAAIFAKENLMDFIVRQKSFWSDDDEGVLRAIREGFIQTHQAMWKELEKWPKTPSGLPSTAGTTASIAFVRRGKIYIGHVGDSAIVLGMQHPENPQYWIPRPLTRDHKPESVEESKRIQESGGKVVCKSGVPRVVWNRPKVGHQGMVRRSTTMDEIPFLAVARSLGDLWSYNSKDDVFVVSPEPDVFVYPIDVLKHRCLILGSDGAWNMLTPAQAVMYVCQAERSNEQHLLDPDMGNNWINPSKRLVDRAIEKWNLQNLRADNTTVVTVMLDPPGPPRLQVLQRQREKIHRLQSAFPQVLEPGSGSVHTSAPEPLSRLTPISGSTCSPPVSPPKKIEPKYLQQTPSTTIERSKKTSTETTESSRPSELSPTTSGCLRGAADSSSHADRSCESDDQVPEDVDESGLTGDIQCNEISSSEDETKPTRTHLPPIFPKKPQLSRELSALQIVSQPLRSTRSSASPNKSRYISNRENQDDNKLRNLRSSSEVPLKSNLPPVSSKSSLKGESNGRAVLQKVSLLNQVKFIKAALKRPTSATRLLRSQHSPETPRSLRPRSTTSTPSLSLSARKRKVLATPSHLEAKMPRHTPPAPIHKKPIITRSKTARVLQLRK